MRLLLFLAILVLPAALHAVDGAHHAKATGCSSLGSTPIDFSNDYASVFDRYGCTSCHRPPTPPRDLDLSGTQFDAACGLVNQASASAPIERVEPGNPAQSLLYQVINCDVPDGAFRMANPTLADQAIIHDWIARGAPVASGDCPNPELRDGFESQRTDDGSGG